MIIVDAFSDVSTETELYRMEYLVNLTLGCQGETLDIADFFQKILLNWLSSVAINVLSNLIWGRAYI